MIANKMVKGKFNPNWKGFYVIEKANERGAYQLADYNGKNPMPLVIDQFLKRYHALKKRMTSTPSKFFVPTST